MNPAMRTSTLLMALFCFIGIDGSISLDPDNEKGEILVTADTKGLLIDKKLAILGPPLIPPPVVVLGAPFFGGPPFPPFGPPPFLGPGPLPPPFFGPGPLPPFFGPGAPFF